LAAAAAGPRSRSAGRSMRAIVKGAPRRRRLWGILFPGSQPCTSPARRGPLALSGGRRSPLPHRSPRFRLPIRWDAGKHWGPGLQTMVLSETRPEAGLTLLRVLRGGLGLGECLGGTASRANDLLETAPRTGVRGFGSHWRGDRPAPGHSNARAMALAAPTGSDRRAFLSSRVAA
jgi:hypothetical protein